MFDVVVVGSLNLDLVVSAERIPSPGETVTGTGYHEYPGGKGLNQAVAAARAGARVAMVGAVGDDGAGETLLAVLTDDGIDASDVVTVEGVPTGRASITVDAEAENSIVVVPGTNGHVSPAVVLPSARVLLLQLEIPLPSVVSVARRAADDGVLVVLNPAPAVDLPDDLLAACSVVVPNEHEVELIGGVDAVVEQGVRTVIVTRGAEGVSIHSSEGRLDQPAFPVDPVDTTGAGDAFCGALGARLAAGDDVAAAVAFAAAAGALATTRHGAVPSLPRRSDIDAVLGPS